MDDSKWICRHCGLPLEKKKVVFDSLGHNFGENLDCCPKCGKVMLPKWLVETKVTEVETSLEEK